MREMFNKIDDLSNYTFYLGILNSFLHIRLNDDDEITSAEFLQLLEKGSILHNIVATRPIEQTIRLMNNAIMIAYNDCIKMIVEQDASKHEIEERLIRLAQILKIRLQSLVDQSISSQIECKIYYKDRKIN